MPETLKVPRTKTVRTTTEEEIPVEPKEDRGLGASWQDYLRGLSEDQAAITTLYLYRMQPVPVQGFLAKVFAGNPDAKFADPRVVDEQWIADYFGGGVFDLAIRSKDGRSHFERNIRIFGEPKLTEREKAANSIAGPSAPVAASAVSAADASNQRLADLIDKLIDRLATLQTPAAPSNTETNKAVMDLMQDAAKRAVELAGGSQPKPGADDDLERMFKKAMIDRLLAPPRNDLAAQLEMLKQMREIMAPPSESKGIVSQIKELAELKELLGWGGAGGESAGKRSLYDLGAELITNAPNILEKWTEIGAQRVANSHEQRLRAEAARDAYRGPRPPAGLPTSTSPAGAQAVPASSGLRMAPLAPEGEAPQPVAVPPVTAEGQVVDTESVQFVEFVKRRIAEMVSQEYDGQAIVDFLDGAKQHKFIEMLGRFTPDQITTFLAQDPVLRPATQHPRWLEILGEAQEYIRSAIEGAKPTVSAKPN